MTCFRFFEKAVNQLFACDKNLREKVFRASSSRTFLTANKFGMSKFFKDINRHCHEKSNPDQATYLLNAK